MSTSISKKKENLLPRAPESVLSIEIICSFFLFEFSLQILPTLPYLTLPIY